MSSGYDQYILEAYHVALASEDPSTQNGGVLLNVDGQVIGRGANNFPEGVDKKYYHGEKEAKYARVGHAEINAIADAARAGYATEGSALVCPWSACSNCSKYMAIFGVKKLVRHTYSNNGADTGSHWYKDCEIGDEIMREAGVEILEVEPVRCGIQLRRNGSLWSPGVTTSV